MTIECLNSKQVQVKYVNHPKHREDMGNRAANCRLPDVLQYFAAHCNPCFTTYQFADKAFYLYQGSVLVIFAIFIRTTSLDSNNIFALILLYFGPAAHIDGLRMHPVAMEDNSNLALLGSQVPDVIFSWIAPIISPFIGQENAHESTRFDAPARSGGDSFNTLINAHLSEPFV